MHYFEKMLSASGSFTPRLPPGLCRWTLLGDFRPSDPLIAHPWKKYPARAHVNILQKWPNFRLTWFGSAYHTQIWSRSVPNSENNAPMKNWFTCIVFNLAARAAAPHQLEVHRRLGPRLNMKPRLEHFAYPLFTGEGGGKKSCINRKFTGEFIADSHLIVGSCWPGKCPGAMRRVSEYRLK